MRHARQIFFVALIIALFAYSSDCGAALTPEQAMQCCDSMPCSSQGQHGSDCCDSMPAMHPSLAQPVSAARVSFTPVVFAMLHASIEFNGVDSSEAVITAHANPPPISSSPGSVPLRI
jgi:hypothetical protein